MLKCIFFAVQVTVSILFDPIFTCENRPHSYSFRTEEYNNVTEISDCAWDSANLKEKHLGRLSSFEDATWLPQSEVAEIGIATTRKLNCTWSEILPSSEFCQTKKTRSVPCFGVQCHSGEESAELKPHNRDGRDGGPGCIRAVRSAEEPPLLSSAPAGPWSHSPFALIRPLADAMLREARRRSLPRHKNIRSLAQPPTFGLTFHKCAQVDAAKEFPLVTFFLLINNTGTPAATDLSQLGIQDAVSGLTIVNNSGAVVEKGFQSFTSDSLSAGSVYVVKYTASVKGHRNEILALPAYLTFSNASQNDINLFGPVVANFTLRVTSAEKISPNHSVHFAGFVGAFLLSALLLSLGLALLPRIQAAAQKHPLQQRKNRAVLSGDGDPEYATCNISETAKEEAAFEDKMVDIMVLEDPQNMYQALENLDMSNLLRAATSLESVRVQIHKDVVAALLRGLRLRGLLSAQAERRLLSVLQGQLMGMEGKLKEEHVARMAALAGQCNMETRQEMEAEHRREASEKDRAGLLFQHADQQVVLECSVLLDKLHKLDQNRLQRSLLARHEEASAQVQRQIVVRRRVELHKIFSEELEEATRMGEMEKNVANDLLHDYFTCQDQLEEVLDVFLATHRSVLGERHAQRQFLVHSLQSLKSLICEVFAKTSGQVESWFRDLRSDHPSPREASVAEDQLNLLLEKAQKELVLVKQGLDEALTRERSAMHCGLVKKRRGLISDKLQEHKQKQKELSVLSRTCEEGLDPAHYLISWQNLLIAQCLELGELINNLDEEAAADIRKVTMRAIHSAVAEVKALQPGAAQALLGLGAPRFLLQPELVGGAMPEAQEWLQQEGKAAVRTLQSTRDALQDCMELELQEQQALRQRGRAFFQALCEAQLTLSEEELLQMKLEFQKCMSRMDRCLVLPRALSRSRLQAFLSQWRKEALERSELGLAAAPPGKQAEKKPRVKVAAPEHRQSPDLSDLLLFQKQAEEKIRLYEQEKEMERTAMKKVLEEMRSERELELRAQEESLAVQTAALHFQKAEKRSRVLETYGALLSLQSLLVENMRVSGTLGGAEITHCIHSHGLGLEEAELVLQRERAEWEVLSTAHSGGAAPGDTDDDDDDEDDDEEGGLFHVNQNCRIAVSLQGALEKREQILSTLDESMREKDTRHQVMEDLKDQLEFKRLHMHLDQDLEFTADLLKRGQTPVAVVLETLRLLLPTAPESDLLSLVDALCPKQAAAPPTSERDRGWADGSRNSLLARLRGDMVSRNVWTGLQDREKERMVKKRQRLLGKLFSECCAESSRSPRLVSAAGRSGEAPRGAEISGSGTLAATGGESPREPQAGPFPAPTPNLASVTAPTPVPDPTLNPAPVPDPLLNSTPVPTFNPTLVPNPTLNPTPVPTLNPAPVPTLHLTPVANLTLNPANVPTLNPTPSPNPAPIPNPVPNPAPAAEVWDMPHTGEKVFVFRLQPESQDSADRPGGKRGKKRNFLNFKKGSIAPQDQ
ncbi:limbin-like isoform X1 [Anguilla anguilla]|uniref:limbin-like isoform X1 n=1 Tax=Anguilla anguilla TaxID=7936 RepID=UPI0015AC2EA6|nr:limbin-like isoform X1 [Anguilla anguilla]